MLRRGAIGVLLFAGMVALTAQLWRTTPGSLVPDEDTGFYIGAVFLPDGATLQRTDAVVQQATQAIKANPANEHVVAFTGLDFLGGGFRNNAATVFVTQKHWDERPGVGTQQLVGEFYGRTAHIKEALVLAFNPPPIFGLGTAGGFEFYIQNRGEGGPKRLNEVSAVPRARQQRPDAGRRADAVALQRAAALRRRRPREGEGARRADRRRLYATLAATLGTYYVNDFNKYGRTWQVLMSAEPAVPQAAGRIGEHLRPLANDRRDGAAEVAREGPVHSSGPDSLDRFNNLPAVKMLRPGRARRVVGPGDRARRADRRRSAAARVQLRLGRRVVPGEALERHVDASRSAWPRSWCS
jgi:multidrug efflux pump subunit AcrB